MSITQMIFLDGKQIGERVRSSRLVEPDGEIEKIVTWTASADNIEPGAHTVEVRVSCDVPNAPPQVNCLIEGFEAVSTINTLWANHPE